MLLLLLRERELYRPLGFVRLGDYAGERLGLSYRTAQEMMRVAAALESLPLAAAAFEAGEVTSGHVRLLTRVAEPENEAFWVGLARRLGVKEFGRAVAAHERRDKDGPAGRPGDGAVARGGVVGGAVASDGSGPGSSVDSEEPALERLEIVAPAWVAGLWRDSVALVRRLAGNALPPGACFEMVLAEAACAVPAEDRDLSGAVDPDRLQDSALADRGDGAGAAGRSGAADGPPESEINARAVDAELRRLINDRQRVDLLLADHLRLVACDRGYRDEGFASLEEYGAERFGLPPRSLYHLLALQRALEPLPALRRAYLAGRLTARQALLVGGVATRLSADAWLRRAERVTLRRLEDEVSLCQRLRESRPEVWDLLDGGPLPEGLVLVPGQPPRASRPAPSGGGASGGCSDRRAPITPEAFIRALEEDEAATPLPARTCTIRLRIEPDVREMWEATLIHLRATIRPDLKEWEALALLLREFWRVWDNAETRRQRRENPTLERDGWRCTAPGCWSVGTGRLHEHHVVFRSAGGAVDDPSNVTSLCTPHHLGLLHEGKIRCSGRAPDGLLWEMGVERGREPFTVFRDETRIGGAAS